MNEIAVITAVTGDYEHGGSHLGYREDTDYIYFTDGLSGPADPQWKVAYLPESDYDDRRRAKLPKLHPHGLRELEDYKYVIWIDGSMQIQTEWFVPEILSFLDNGLVLSPHFDGRDCGYGEATIRPLKYINEPLDEQVAFYKKEGFPEHYGLWEAGVQARRMDAPGLRKFGHFWYMQNMVWSYQDQVSCGYSMWKTGFKPDTLPMSWREYGWLHLNAHKRED